jgi:hypothetical protein
MLMKFLSTRFAHSTVSLRPHLHALGRCRGTAQLRVLKRILAVAQRSIVCHPIVIADAKTRIAFCSADSARLRRHSRRIAAQNLLAVREMVDGNCDRAPAAAELART